MNKQFTCVYKKIKWTGTNSYDSCINIRTDWTTNRKIGVSQTVTVSSSFLICIIFLVENFQTDDFKKKKMKSVSGKRWTKTISKMLMKSKHYLIFMSFIALTACLSENLCENECTHNSTIIHRSKRYLDFIPLSRMFVCIHFCHNGKFCFKYSLISFELISKTISSKWISFGLRRMVFVPIFRLKIRSEWNVVMCTTPYPIWSISKFWRVNLISFFFVIPVTEKMSPQIVTVLLNFPSKFYQINSAGEHRLDGFKTFTQ